MILSWTSTAPCIPRVKVTSSTAAQAFVFPPRLNSALYRALPQRAGSAHHVLAAFKADFEAPGVG